MPLANDDDVIKTFLSDGRSVANAHGPDAPDEGSAIRAVAVADQVAWRLVPAASLSQLTGKPCRSGMGCHTQPQKLAA